MKSMIVTRTRISAAAHPSLRPFGTDQSSSEPIHRLIRGDGNRSTEGQNADSYSLMRRGKMATPIHQLHNIQQPILYNSRKLYRPFVLYYRRNLQCKVFQIFKVACEFQNSVLIILVILSFAPTPVGIGWNQRRLYCVRGFTN